MWISKQGAGRAELAAAKGHVLDPSWSRSDGRRQPADDRERPRRRGPAGAFSLIELLVVITVIAILAAISLMTLGYVNRKSALSRTQAEIATLAAAIDSFKLDYGSYPASNSLYNELTGTSATINTNRKIYIEPTPQMLSTNGKSVQFADPYGAPYNYTTTPARNIGFFDLWSVPPPPEGDPGNPATWVHN
jgi:prepilin-type N-terminal cleavage/methylation domain-containing protein